MTNGPFTTEGNLVKNGIYLAFPCSTCPNTNKVKIHMGYPRSRSRGYTTWGPWIKVTPKTAREVLESLPPLAYASNICIYVCCKV
jgi:hypothetical protein